MTRNFRVGIVGPCPPPHGGVTRLISNHLNYWEDLPVEAWLFPPAMPDLPEVYPQASLVSHREHRKSLAGFVGSVLRLGTRLAPMRPASLLNVLSFDIGLRQAIREHAIDVLYAHHADWTGMVAITEARRAGIPSVLVAYGETWLSQPADIRWKRAIEFSVSKADWVVSTSEHCRRGAIERGADPRRSSVIYAGIDLKHFRPGVDDRQFRASHHIPSDAVVISVLGLALRRKLETFLDALKPLLNIPNVHVLIGGTGADARYLDERVASLGTERVKALGFVPEKDLPTFYAATDILVASPRTLVECMGQSMKEAMACGRTVVGPDLGGVPEAIEPGVSGVLFEPDNPADLIRVLLELVPAPQLRHSMGARGRAIAEARFDARTSAHETFDLLKLLAHRARHP